MSGNQPEASPTRSNLERHHPDEADVDDPENGDAANAAVKLKERSEALQAYRLTLEYKALKSNAPGGVCVVPSFDSLYLWFGVIFVRRGLYANAIFKFRVNIPTNYNQEGTYPKITFTSPVFNPMVDPGTGELDLKSDYPEWNPDKHYIVTALTYVKKIFYMKEFNYEHPANPEAQRLFKDDRPKCWERVTACVQASIQSVYEIEDGSTLRFTEPKPVHDKVAERVLAPLRDPGGGRVSLMGHDALLANIQAVQENNQSGDPEATPTPQQVLPPRPPNAKAVGTLRQG